METQDGVVRCAVLGAGPIGLEAALYAARLGLEVTVYEAGPTPAAAVLDWGHVTLFSPFGMNRSPLGASLLKQEGHVLPQEDAYLTGEEYVEAYLRPLAELPLLEGRVRQGVRIVAIGKEGLGKADLIANEARLKTPFRMLMEEDGEERMECADIVLDCTGMYGNPNWLGNGGIPAAGERYLREKIEYRLPEVLGRERERYAGKTTLLAGDGYSAATTLFSILELAEDEPGTRVIWLTNHVRNPRYEVIEADPLPRRAKLIQDANRVAEEGHEALEQIPGAFVEEISAAGEAADMRFKVQLSGDEEREVAVDRIVANIGFSPDDSIYSELQVHECYASRAPMKLAAALLAADGGGGDCLAVPSLGPDTLKNPEPGFFILGSKSYGKGFNFLLKNGYDQVRDAFTLITGRADLDLYKQIHVGSGRGDL